MNRHTETRAHTEWERCTYVRTYVQIPIHTYIRKLHTYTIMTLCTYTVHRGVYTYSTYELYERITSICTIKYKRTHHSLPLGWSLWLCPGVCDGTLLQWRETEGERERGRTQSSVLHVHLAYPLPFATAVPCKGRVWLRRLAGQATPQHP